MKLLIINELYQYGGAEMQTQREATICRKHGHEVKIMTLDSAFEDGWLSEFNYNISRKDGRIKTQLQRCFVDIEIKERLRKFIDVYAPDYIHINNAYEHAASIFHAVKGYKTLQTIRDYGAVCPNGMSIYPNKMMCKGYQDCLQCSLKCFMHSERKIKAYWQWICFKRKDYIRKRSIRQFACPSHMLTEYCKSQGMNTVCINNPFDFLLLDNIKVLEEKKTHLNKRTFLYYGQIVEHKGIREMVQAFAEFAFNKSDVELDLLGRVPVEYESVLNDLISKYGNGKIKYLGVLPYEKTIQYLSKVYAVVIPSLWIENYPNTALEAAGSGCMVLASERGGMKEIVGDGCLVFHVLQQKEIVERFEEAYNISQQQYDEIVEHSRKRVRQNNSMERYYERLMNWLKEIN